VVAHPALGRQTASGPWSASSGTPLRRMAASVLPAPATPRAGMPGLSAPAGRWVALGVPRCAVQTGSLACATCGCFGRRRTFRVVSTSRCCGDLIRSRGPTVWIGPKDLHSAVRRFHVKQMAKPSVLVRPDDSETVTS
jgi:hypothetical protein